jgi:hypothetical protein
MLVVRAEDVSGHFTVDSRSIRHDELPVIDWPEPIELSVARPSLHFAASCTDDDPAGCTSLRVTAQAGSATEMLVETEGDAIDETHSLATFDGREVTLVLEVTDSTGQVVTTGRTAFVNPAIASLAPTMSSERLWPLNERYIASLDESGGSPIVKLHDRLLDEDAVLLDDPKRPSRTSK